MGLEDRGPSAPRSSERGDYVGSGVSDTKTPLLTVEFSLIRRFLKHGRGTSISPRPYVGLNNGGKRRLRTFELRFRVVFQHELVDFLHPRLGRIHHE